MKKESGKKIVKRDSIIKSASAIFKEKGFDNTTMKDIAKQVKKGKSSIYYYFSSKDEIFQNVVMVEAVNFRRKIISAVNKETNPIEKIKAYITTRMKILKIYQNFHLTLKNDKFSHIPFFKRLNQIYDKEEIRLFRNILDEGVKNKYLKNGIDISVTAVAIIMAIKGIETYFFESEKESAFQYNLEKIIEVLLYGIALK